MAQNNVVPMTRTYRGIKDAEAAMNVIRHAMYPHDPEDLARKCAVSKSCIYAIRSGRTKWPRHSTFFQLLYVLDLQMIIAPR